MRLTGGMLVASATIILSLHALVEWLGVIGQGSGLHMAMQAILIGSICFSFLLPSAAAMLPLTRSVRVLWKDLLLVVSMVYLSVSWLFIIPYVAVRQWSLNVPIGPPEDSSSKSRRQLVFGGRLILSLVAPFLVISYYGGWEQMMIAVPIVAWAFLRMTHFIRLCTPDQKRMLVDVPLAIPGIAGVVGVAALYLSGIAVDGGFLEGADLSGAEELGGEAIGGEALAGAEGAGASVSETGVQEVGGGVNDLGVPLGELEQVDGYITSDGVVVEPYTRTVADGTTLNNLNT